MNANKDWEYHYISSSPWVSIYPGLKRVKRWAGFFPYASERINFRSNHLEWGYPTLWNNVRVKTPRETISYYKLHKLIEEALSFQKAFGWANLTELHAAGDSLWNLVVLANKYKAEDSERVLELALAKVGMDYLAVKDALEADYKRLTNDVENLEFENGLTKIN